jgi:hypothetical protein
MKRRDVLRRSGGALLTTGLLGLAGCSDSQSGGDGTGKSPDGDGGGSDSGGDGNTTGSESEEPTATDSGDGNDGGGDDGGDGDSGSETPTAADATETDTATTTPCAEASGDPTGEVTENVVTGIDVTDYSAQRASDSFTVSVTLKNVGEKTTTMEYNIDVTTYDANGTALNQGFTTIQRSYTSEYAPGESQTFEVQPQLDCPSAVARYEIEVNCAATPNGGDYCD